VALKKETFQVSKTWKVWELKGFQNLEGLEIEGFPKPGRSGN